jgi:hypothetical protein
LLLGFRFHGFTSKQVSIKSRAKSEARGLKPNRRPKESQYRSQSMDFGMKCCPDGMALMK